VIGPTQNPYVTIHKIHKKRTSIPPVGLQDTTPEGEDQQIKYINDHVKFKPVFFVLEEITWSFRRIMTARGDDDFLQETSDEKEESIEIVIKCLIYMQLQSEHIFSLNRLIDTDYCYKGRIV